MSCKTCSTKDGKPNGCQSNGTCGTDGCNKLTVFNWLSDLDNTHTNLEEQWVEVRFKNGRKEYLKNLEKLTLQIGDIVATQAKSGHDIGIVTLTGELVKTQMKKKKIQFKEEEICKVYRKATQKDVDVWQKARSKENDMQVRAREIAIELKLKMKISDVEYQGDSSKVVFYYTAEGRVDFRELIKRYASEFKTRIEMKHVGLRQEAARLGGIGSCGRELCCSTWLTDFRTVSTSAARYQQLSLNPLKLAGQCGKLKCCLNFELTSYQSALKNFPSSNTKLQTEKGVAVCQKIDIFKGLMWFFYKNDSMKWVKLHIDSVHEIIKLNKEGKKVASIEEFEETEVENKLEFDKVDYKDNLDRFDKPKTRNKKRRNYKKPVKNNKQNPSNKNASQTKSNKNKQKTNKPNPNQVKNNQVKNTQNKNKPKNFKKKPTNNRNAKPKKDNTKD